MSRAAFEMDEQLKEIALRVAKEIPEFLWSENCGHESGVIDPQVIDFASRFLAALPKPEPVGVCDTENRIRWGGNDSSHRYSSAPNWLRVGTHIYAPATPPAALALARADLEAERQRVAEACAKVCENDESGRDSGGYFADTIRAGQWREHL